MKTDHLNFLVSTVLLLALVQCSPKNPDGREVSECELNRREALEEYKRGSFTYIDRDYSRYDEELMGLLVQNGIKYGTDPFGHVYACYDEVMDSLIAIKYGSEFITKTVSKADSLFFEKHKEETFHYYEVDTRALRKNDHESLGGDFIINFLNKRIPPKPALRIVSNCVGRPHYIIEFTIDTLGNTNDVAITERNGTEKLGRHLEATIVKEVGNISGWIPATIRNEPVKARFQMGVAIDTL